MNWQREPFPVNTIIQLSRILERRSSNPYLRTAQPLFTGSANFRLGESQGAFQVAKWISIR